MPTNANEFVLDVSRVARQMSHDEVIRFVKWITKEAFSRIVYRTPFRTGLAKGNWQVTIGNPNDTVIYNYDPVGASTVRNGFNVIDGVNDLKNIYIFNNVRYIEFLESGSSLQAPRGMVAITLAELQDVVDNL